MGWEEGLARRALELVQGDVEAAVEVLLSGDVTEAGVSRLFAPRQEVVSIGPDEEEFILQQLLAKDENVGALLRGETLTVHITVQGRACHAVVNLADINAFFLRRIGVDFQTYVATGGIQRYGPVFGPNAPREQSTQVYQQRIDQLWLEKYNGLPPAERAYVDSLGYLHPNFAIVVQVFFACQKRVAEAAQALQAIGGT
jgi:hypothetical protein